MSEIETGAKAKAEHCVKIDDMEILAKLAMAGKVSKPRKTSPPPPPKPKGLAIGGYVLFESLILQKFIVRRVIEITKTHVILKPNRSSTINPREIGFPSVILASLDRKQVEQMERKINRLQDKYLDSLKKLRQDHLSRMRELIGL
ncbi:hypothetical protein WSS15_20920 [Acetobacter pasteurianus]|uniref:hypothetical protein n=1 Tax=Acetobacter pasteurianus TaxID=438 RepID=UPI0022BADB96|nr:hypothetical protein [Acetobacter pasteurianus]GLH29442.1 hypothetical protein WSS15_20920 [Acetobacter pasteurianus]